MNLIRVMTALVSDIWLLPPAVHKTLTDIVRAHAFGGDDEAAQHAIAARMPANPQKRMFEVAGNTAVIPIEGIIGRKYSNALYSSGVTSIDVLDRMLSAAEDDDEVDSALLIFDSPGGYSMGVAEVAAHIGRLNEKKPVISYADGLMDSAAYWLASQSYAIYAMPSADIGSIGAYMALLDISRNMELQGLKMEVFKSGRFKAMGLEGTSLTDEQRVMLQAHVDKTAAKFKAMVRAGRAGQKISDDVMQGQSFDTDAALANGLIDSVSTLDEALRDVASEGKKKRKG